MKRTKDKFKRKRNAISRLLYSLTDFYNRQPFKYGDQPVPYMDFKAARQYVFKCLSNSPEWDLGSMTLHQTMEMFWVGLEGFYAWRKEKKGY